MLRQEGFLQVKEAADRHAIEAQASIRLSGANGGRSIDDAMRETAAAGWDAPR